MAAILLFTTIRGFSKGLIRTLFSCLTIFLALLITSQLHHFVGKGLVEFTNMSDSIQSQISNTLKVDPETEDEVVRTDQTKIIEGMNLPAGIKKGLTENNNADIYKAFEANGFYDYISKYLTSIIMNAISFMITMAATIIALRLILRMLDFLAELPILNGINRVGGLLFGAAQGLAVIWVFFIIVTIFGATTFGQDTYRAINDSTILSVLYNNNLLLAVITSMSSLLF